MENQENTEKEESKKILLVSVGILLIFFVICTIFSIYLINKKNKTQNFIQNTNAEQSDSSSAPKLLIVPKIPVFRQNESYNFTIKRKIQLNGKFTKLKLSLGLPVSVNKRQKITDLQITPKPDEIIDNGDKKIAVYYYKNPPSQFNITYDGTSISQAYTSEKAIKLNRNIDGFISEKDFQTYTSPEKGIESDNPKLIKIAQNIPNGKDRMQTVKNIFDFVDNYLIYDINIKNSSRGLLSALFTKSGTCTEFSALFVALCRAKNIPARVIKGFNLPFEDNIEGEYYAHAWAEVWFDEYGWVNFDPTIDYDEKIVAYIKKHKLSYFDVVNASTANRNYLIYNDTDVHIDYETDDKSKVKLFNYPDKIIFYKTH